MSHEAIIYGVIIGVSLRGTATYRALQERNAAVIAALPPDEEHPWVDASIFALPGPFPVGTFRRQAIHVGLTLKEDTQPIIAQDGVRQLWQDIWLQKFEAVLKQLYWSSARLIIESDFSPQRREFTWIPTAEASTLMYAEPHTPVLAWERVMTVLAGEKLYGT